MRKGMLSLALLGMLLGGCGGPPVEERPPVEDSKEYGKLPGLTASPDLQLGDELARIVEESGTPEKLSQVTVAEADNVAAGLLDLFPKRQVKSIRRQSEELFPPGAFQLNPVELTKAIDFRKKYDAERLEARTALERTQCDFGIEFMAGVLAELDFIAVVRICARLEAFLAAESLADGKPERAVESLAVMLRLASCLGAEKHVQPRLEAAYLRTEAFRVLQAIVDDEHTVRADIERLYEIVREHMKTWPDDAGAWIGDRALGLHAYEFVRDGGLLDLLSSEELDSFGKEGSLSSLSAAALRNVNADELYYLETMRKIIDACGLPYYKRVALFDSIQADLQEKRNSPKFPLVAARLLLPGIRESHVTQTRDRANWEAWLLALALAARRPLPPYGVNPLNGRQYRLSTEGNLVVVEDFGTGEDGDHPIIRVPDLAGEAKR